MEWHSIKSPDDPELDRLAERYQLHPLHIEDCRHRDQRAKVEESNSYVFVVLKVVRLMPDETLEASDLDIFLGKDFLISVQEANHPILQEIICRVEASRLVRADVAFYRILDAVVDSYLPVMDQFSESIDELEDTVLNTPSPDALARILQNKRRLIQTRRVLGNMRDVTGHVQKTECPLIASDLLPFLRDVYDHLARNLDLIEMQRDLLTGSLDIYLSSVANRTNQVMKVLTVLGTIALPSIVISGFFGMNLHGLPWFGSDHGTLIAAGLMLASTVALLILLRILRWF
jgi:magnesium transporter